MEKRCPRCNSLASEGRCECGHWFDGRARLLDGLEAAGKTGWQALLLGAASYLTLSLAGAVIENLFFGQQTEALLAGCALAPSVGITAFLWRRAVSIRRQAPHLLWAAAFLTFLMTLLVRTVMYLDAGSGDGSAQIRWNPYDAYAYQKRGRVLLELERPGEALVDFDRALLLRPKDAILYVLRAQAYLALGDRVRALQDLDRAAELDPITCLDRGRFYLEWGQHRRALPDLERAIQAGARTAYVDRGQLWAELGDYTKALDDFATAVKAMPGATRAYLESGSLRQKLGGSKEAVDYYQQAYYAYGSEEIQQGAKARAYLLRGELHEALGHSKQALADYRRVYYSPHHCPEEMRQNAGARIEALKGGPP